MSFESKMKNRGNKNLNKYAKNPYHVAWFNQMPMWSKIVVPTALLVILVGTTVVVSASVSQMRASKNNNQTISNGASSNEMTSYAPSSINASSNIDDPSSVQARPNWEDLTMPEKYNRISYEQGSYLYNSYIEPIDEENVGELLTNEVIAKGGDYLNGDFIHQQNVAIYAIKNISFKMIIAVKLPDDNNFYIYFNSAQYNQYATIGDLFTYLPLDVVPTYNDAFYEYNEEGTYNQYQFLGITKDNVMNILFNNMLAPSAGTSAFPESLIKSVDVYNKKINIPLYFPALHIYQSMPAASGVTIYDNGCLKTTIFNHQNTFYIGTETYQAFEDYLLNSGLTSEKIN